MSIGSWGQDHPSPHALQSGNPPAIVESSIQPETRKGTASLSHAVFGYHPYWISASSIDRYRFDLLSHVAYFSYEVNPSTGKPNTIRDWLTTPLVEKAKAAGTSVSLSVTNFGSANNTAVLSSQAARDTLIATVVRLVKQRGGDGVNIDFESIPGSQRANLVMFFRDLRARMDAEIPGGIVSVAAPAVDWNGAWDVAALSQYIDVFFVMCYDYYWSGSSTAGPVSPLQTGSYNVKKSIEWYIAQGAPKRKIVMGVPYYGYDWPTVDDTRQSPTSGSAQAVTYSTARSAVLLHGRLWDDVHKNPWYKYQSGSWRQTWYDDEQSLGLKFDLALSLGIGGVGMWALGYDGSYPELWNVLAEKFSRPTASAGLQHPGDGFDTYPTPVRDVLTIRSNGGSEEWEARIVDFLGREVANVSRRSTEATVSLRGTPPGVYHVVVTTRWNIHRSSFILLR